MKKLKKSLNNKSKFILIYGSIGIGKLTIAKELQKITENFGLIHNHMILNLVEEIFNRGENNTNRSDLYMKMFKFILTEASQKNKNIIMTHPYSYSFIYKNGIKDSDFIISLLKVFEDNGGISYPIHLVCEKEENLKRALNKKRKNNKKLVNRKILKEIIEKEDCFTSPNLKNNFKIDTTKLKAKEVTKIIKKQFKL